MAFQQIANAPMAFFTNNVERMRVLANGNVGIGTAAPTANLEVNGTGKFHGLITFAPGQTFPGTGTITGVAAGAGLAGAGTSGSVTLALQNCPSGQELQSTGPAWACIVPNIGTITAVNAGTDLTGGGTSGAVTLNVDNTKVPELASGNVFTAGQTINAAGDALSASGGSGGGSELAGAGVLAYGGNASTSGNFGGRGILAVGGSSLDRNAGDGIDASGGDGGVAGGRGIYALGGVDANGNPAAAGYFAGPVVASFEGRYANPQYLVEQLHSDDFARIRFNVYGAAQTWDIAAGGGTQPPLHFFRPDIGDVLSLTPGGANLLAMSNGAVLTSGGAWTNASDRNAKTAFQDVSGAEVLRHLSAVPITTWSYKTEGETVRHMGPMAQDFAAAFQLGADDKHITTIDEGGVALAAIQELYRQNLQKDEEIRKLTAA